MHGRGFTLIEVLVALAIVGLALPALLFQVMGNVDNQAYLRNKAIAQWVAENKLAESRLLRRTGQRVLQGTASGTTTMAGLQWDWDMRSLDTGVDGMRRLEVDVAPKERQKIVSLVGFVHE